MRIEIWSDVICPFCYIGKTQLETALAQLGAEATIEHKAYRLMPGDPVAPVQEMFARRYGQSPQQAEASLRNVEAMAAQSGLDFHLSKTKTGDTTDAHKLLLLAGDKGVQDDLLTGLYRAYFTDGRDIFDRNVLLAIAAEAGLDAGEAQKNLDSAEMRARVETDQHTAQTIGVRGVPFVVIDRKLAVSGAQGVPNFVQALQAAIAQSPQPEASGPEASDVCGIDGQC